MSRHSTRLCSTTTNNHGLLFRHNKAWLYVKNYLKTSQSQPKGVAAENSHDNMVHATLHQPSSVRHKTSISSANAPLLTTTDNMPAAPPSVHSILQHVPQSQRVSTTNYYFTSVGNRKIIYKCCKKLRSAQANKMARRSNDTILLVAAHRRVTFPSSWKTT